MLYQECADLDRAIAFRTKGVGRQDNYSAGTNFPLEQLRQTNFRAHTVSLETMAYVCSPAVPCEFHANIHGKRQAFLPNCLGRCVHVFLARLHLQVQVVANQ